MRAVKAECAGERDRFTVKHGLVPNTPAWIEYWTAATDRILNGEGAAPTDRIPLSFVDYILSEAARPDRLEAMA